MRPYILLSCIIHEAALKGCGLCGFVQQSTINIEKLLPLTQSVCSRSSRPSVSRTFCHRDQDSPCGSACRGSLRGPELTWPPAGRSNGCGQPRVPAAFWGAPAWATCPPGCELHFACRHACVPLP